MSLKRRDFLFGSLQAAALLSPVFSLRRAEAQAAGAAPKRLFVWVNSAGYADERDFFTDGQGTSWEGEILRDCADLRQQMVIIDGVDIRDSGYNAAGANHARAPGKVVTAADVIDDGGEGLPGGISIDQFVAERLNLTSLEVNVTTDEGRSDESIRERPFATGPGAFKIAIKPPSVAFDRMFGGFVPPNQNDPARDALLKRLRARKSLLDGMTSDLQRLRRELSGMEQLKLDIHEDAIRTAELSVARDLGNVPATQALCTVPPRPTNDFEVKHRFDAHFRTMFATFACNRAQVGAMVWGGSGVGGRAWHYNWAGKNISDLHNDIHHGPPEARQTYTDCSRADWKELGNFVRLLKATPEGDGTLLDHTIVLGISHFSYHHDIRRLPVVLFGTQKGGLNSGRYLKLQNRIHNDKVLTSVARLMGVPNVNGFGNDQSCGPVPGL
ncbi:MAG: DUF1552 domain-containing protein [Myxococcaceae bacterium]|nr:DUF1552 domain-containing protein [Myxococcaceae bacterium]